MDSEPKTDGVHGLDLDEKVSRKEWQSKLKEVQLRNNYPQNFGRQVQLLTPQLLHTFLRMLLRAASCSANPKASMVAAGA